MAIRACMVTYSNYQIDNRVMRYAETLAKRGDHVDVISLRSPGEPKREWINGVLVHRVHRRATKVQHRLGYALGILLFCLRAMLAMIRLQMQNAYQLIHIHSMPDFVVFTAWMPRMMGAKIILDIHDLLPDLYASRYNHHEGSSHFKLLLAEERLSSSFAHHVIIANHLWYDRVLSRSVPGGNCTVIMNAPDRTIFRPGERTRNDGKFVMFYPGSFNWHQGLDLAVQAVHLLRDKIPNLELQLCGSGPEEDKLGAMIDRLHLRDRVILLPPRPIRQVAELIQQADLGVVPKRKDFFGNEAFSTKTLEFMASRVPVIVADTKVDRFYFNDSLVKFFRGGDVDDLAAGIELLAHTPQLRASLINNAWEFVQRNDWATNQHIYLDLVDDLTGVPRSSFSVAASVM